MRIFDEYPWTWIGDAVYHFKSALGDLYFGLRCLWWFVCSIAEYVWYVKICKDKGAE